MARSRIGITVLILAAGQDVPQGNGVYVEYRTALTGPADIAQAVILSLREILGLRFDAQPDLAITCDSDHVAVITRPPSVFAEVSSDYLVAGVEAGNPNKVVVSEESVGVRSYSPNFLITCRLTLHAPSSHP